MPALAIPAAIVAWNVPWTNFGLQPLLEQARPVGIAEGVAGEHTARSRERGGRRRAETRRAPEVHRHLSRGVDRRRHEGVAHGHVVR